MNERFHMESAHSQEKFEETLQCLRRLQERFSREVFFIVFFGLAVSTTNIGLNLDDLKRQILPQLGLWSAIIVSLRHAKFAALVAQNDVRARVHSLLKAQPSLERRAKSAEFGVRWEDVV